MPSLSNSCEHPNIEEMWIEVCANDESATIRFQDYCEVCGSVVGDSYTRKYKYVGEE